MCVTATRPSCAACWGRRDICSSHPTWAKRCPEVSGSFQHARGILSESPVNSHPATCLHAATSLVTRHSTRLKEPHRSASTTRLSLHARHPRKGAAPARSTHPADKNNPPDPRGNHTINAPYPRSERTTASRASPAARCCSSCRTTGRSRAAAPGCPPPSPSTARGATGTTCGWGFSASGRASRRSVAVREERR